MPRPPLDVLVYTDAVRPGGAEVSLSHLVTELPERIRVEAMGVSPEILGWVTRGRPGTRTWVLAPVRGKWDAPRMAAHLRTLWRLRPKVLHVNLRAPWACSYAIAAGIATPGVRVVAVEQLPMPLNDELQRRLKRWSSRRLAAHVAVGHGSARELEREIGLPHGSIRVVYNGVPEVRLEPRDRVAEGPVVGSLGRLHAQKGYDVLVRALPDLPGVTAVLVGDGEERSALEELAERLGVADRLRILGWTDDARSQLTSFDVFALPSRYEGFPLSIVEAMQAGLPVVASDVGSIAEALDAGRAGVLVPPDDPEALAAAIAGLIDDEPRRARIGEHARRLGVERHTARVMADAFLKLYEEIAATPGRRRGAEREPLA
jgi:glycosyltransferase involved in cell wall biosynthesis